jgi:putative transposase
MNEKGETTLRRKAIRLLLKGLRPSAVLKLIPRGRTWLHKWWRRYQENGRAGLKSHSRRPEQAPQAHDEKVCAVVLRVRRALERRKIGLIGAPAIQDEIRKNRLLYEIPSPASIKRWLKEAGLIKSAPEAPKNVYYPAPQIKPEQAFQACDWTSRYLPGGQKVFVFHTVEEATRALEQTIGNDKTVTSVRRHLLSVWRRLGLPDVLQLDNDPAFCGGERTARRFGTIVRLCLYVGIQIVFIPPSEPKRNWLVENINNLWGRSFWKRHQFRSFNDVIGRSPQFTRWYSRCYKPQSLNGKTPSQARRGKRCRRLTMKQIASMPEPLPITAGRVHFIRRVAPDGTISFLGETWKIRKNLAHRYVWATIITHRQRLEIYYQRSDQSPKRLIRTFDYQITEPVRRLRPEFRRQPMI